MDVLCRIQQSTDGKDKTLKLIQYSLRMTNIFYSTQPATKLISGLSLGRRVLRLLHSIESINQLLLQQKSSLNYSLVDSILGCLSDLHDDLALLIKLQVLSLKSAASIEYRSSVLWFTSCLINLKLMLANRPINSANAFIHSFSVNERVSLIKLIGDLCFSACDVFDVKIPHLQTLAGFISSIAACYKHVIKAKS